MNAPAVIERPVDHGSPPALPFNLQPYGKGGFDRMHAAGSMLASASGVPSLFNLVPQRHGKLAYGLHLNGDRPLPDISKEPHIMAGHALEPVAAAVLSMKLETDVDEIDAYSMHDYLPMFSTPDRLITIDGVQHIVEIKCVAPRTFWEDWRDGPPVHVGVQHQVQFATTGAERGIIAVFNQGWSTLDWFFTEPNPAAIQRIELEVGEFMEHLADGILPDPDDCEADFEAFRDICWKSEPGKTVKIHGDEALLRMRQFAQSKLDEAAADKTIAANKRFFQGLMKDAETAELDDGSIFSWKTNKSAGKGQRPARVFKLKESNGNENG